MSKKLIVIMLSIILVVGGFYGYKRYKTYKVYKEDAVYLLDFLDDNYPYFQIEEKTLNYRFLDHKDEFIKKIARSRNDADFYKNVSEVICSLQNGHSKINTSPNYLKTDENIVKKNEYWTNVSKQSSYLPDIMCKYVEGKYVVTKSMNSDIPVGSILLKFNGEKINDYITSKKDTFLLIKDFKRNTFYFLTYLYRKFDNTPDNVTISYNGQEKEATINYKLADDKMMDWFLYSLPQFNGDNVITKSLNGGKTAYLRIKTCDGRKFEKSKEIINNFFKEYSNADNIIIDMRGNSGGASSYGDLLIPNLIDKKLVVPKYHCLKNTEFMKERFFLNAKDFRNFVTDVQISEIPKNNYNLDGFRAFKEQRVFEPVHNSIKFKGHIYVLTDELVASASEYFANISKKYNIAKIVGITTLGDGTGMNPMTIFLPNSKLGIQIPPALTISEDGTVNEEVKTQPDIYIEQSLEDYQNYLKSGLTDIIGSKYDTVYNKTLEIINEQY